MSLSYTYMDGHQLHVCPPPAIFDTAPEQVEQEKYSSTHGRPAGDPEITQMLSDTPPSEPSGHVKLEFVTVLEYTVAHVAEFSAHVEWRGGGNVHSYEYVISGCL